MNAQQSSTSTAEQPGERNRSETRFSGRWLLITRIGWVALNWFVSRHREGLRPITDSHQVSKSEKIESAEAR